MNLPGLVKKTVRQNESIVPLSFLSSKAEKHLGKIASAVRSL